MFAKKYVSAIILAVVIILPILSAGGYYLFFRDAKKDVDSSRVDLDRSSRVSHSIPNSEISTSLFSEKEEFDKYVKKRNIELTNTPNVKFESQSVQVVSYTAPSYGYGISAYLNPAGTAIDVEVTRPGENCFAAQSFLTIYDFVVIDGRKNEVPVGVVRQVQNKPCKKL